MLFRSLRTIALRRRSRLLIGFSKYWPDFTIAIAPDCCTLRLKRRSRFSADSFPSLRVTCIISVLFYPNTLTFATPALGAMIRIKKDRLHGLFLSRAL